MSGAQFQSVVICMPDSRLQRIATEVVSQRLARSKLRLFVWTAARRVLAERGNAWVGLDQYQLAMAGCADITRAEHSLRAGLPLD